MRRRRRSLLAAKGGNACEKEWAHWNMELGQIGGVRARRKLGPFAQASPAGSHRDCGKRKTTIAHRITSLLMVQPDNEPQLAPHISSEAADHDAGGAHITSICGQIVQEAVSSREAFLARTSEFGVQLG